MIKAAQSIEELREPTVTRIVNEQEPEQVQLSNIVVYDSEPTIEQVEHVHNEPVEHVHSDVVDSPHSIIVIDLPGAPEGTPDPIIVEDEDEDSKKKKDDADVSMAKDSKKDKWDWSDHDLETFSDWVKEKMDKVPSHSGYDLPGIDRACAYLERLLVEIKKAMRSDLDGVLNSDVISEMCEKIEDGIERLEIRKEKVEKSKNKRKVKKTASFSVGFEKQAQKATTINGITITVPLLIYRLASLCINAVVSAGHDMERVFEEMSNKYKLNARERAELIELIKQMGYATPTEDRGYDPAETRDMTKNTLDLSSNYPA